MKTGIRITTALMVLALSACGGDGGKPASTISGVAATGDAISGGTVTLKCAGGGSVSTVTAVDGRYTLDADRLALPCLAQVRFIDSNNNPHTLHSYVSAKGTTNITPLTELLTAALLQQQPSDIFDQADSNTFQRLAHADPVAAWAAVKATLLAQGVLLPDNFDPLHDSLQAKTATQTGNAHDQLLDVAGFQLTLYLGLSAQDVSLTISMSGSPPVQVNDIYWNAYSAMAIIPGSSNSNSSSVQGFFSGSQFTQVGQTYYLTSEGITIATAASTRQLTGSYNGHLDDGSSCGFTINTDGSMLLHGNDETADHLIPASAFTPARPPLNTTWAFAETDADLQGILTLRAASAEQESAAILRLYEQNQLTTSCTATQAAATPT